MPYCINTAGNLFSVFFVDDEVVDFDGAKRTSVARYAAFFHAMLDRGVYLPPSAFEAWFVGASHDNAALDRIAAALPFAARAAAAVPERCGRRMTETTVHLVRHGEVYNPAGVLYGRLPGFGLSDAGKAMAVLDAEALRGRDITVVRSSPLERAVQTAAPIAAELGVEPGTDDRLIESDNVFEGKTFGVGDGSLKNPSVWRYLWNPFRPSWGEPYAEVADRVLGAVAAARDGGGRPRGSAGQPPAADRGGPAQGRGRPPVASARPAQVRAGVDHVAGLRR